MKNIRQVPPVLFRRIFLTIILGLAIGTFGLIYFSYTSDRILLLLSLALLLGTLLRSYELYRIAHLKKYEILEGVCSTITAKPFGKYNNIRIIDNDGLETTLKLRKNNGLKVGTRYRFYFDQREPVRLGSERLETALNTNHYLGHEVLEKLPEKKS